MKVNEIFHPDFVATLTRTLKTKCVNGQAITRAQLCTALGLEMPEKRTDQIVLEVTVDSLVTLGVIEGYKHRIGRGGGTCEIGDEPAKDSPEAVLRRAQNAPYPEGFLAELRTAMNELAVGIDAEYEAAVAANPAKAKVRGISCQTIAEAMGIPGSDNERLIARAYRAGFLPGWSTKNGPCGGFVKACDVPEDEENEVSDEECVQASSETEFVETSV